MSESQLVWLRDGKLTQKDEGSNQSKNATMTTECVVIVTLGLVTQIADVVFSVVDGF